MRNVDDKFAIGWIIGTVIIVLLSLLFNTGCGPYYELQDCRVLGQAKNAQGEPVVNAQVKLSGITETLVTDHRGIFQEVVIPERPLKVSITHPDYYRADTSFYLSYQGDGFKLLRFQMDKR